MGAVDSRQQSDSVGSHVDTVVRDTLYEQMASRLWMDGRTWCVYVGHVVSELSYELKVKLFLFTVFVFTCMARDRPNFFIYRCIPRHTEGGNHTLESS